MTCSAQQIKSQFFLPNDDKLKKRGEYELKQKCLLHQDMYFAIHASRKMVYIYMGRTKDTSPHISKVRHAPILGWHWKQGREWQGRDQLKRYLNREGRDYEARVPEPKRPQDRLDLPGHCARTSIVCPRSDQPSKPIALITRCTSIAKGSSLLSKLQSFKKIPFT